ncbi:MAG: exodeoxyribonuclease V subunit beta [Alistipes senegalensis]|nr:exodeoxyribonuclease V subunit beta [Oxalobacter formigenes]MCM1281550.1 exodeoxyribonuclease V subunit beta [Alistipes senegalensis]
MTETTIPETLDVLECRLGGMTLIEASAGTGKTWNICMLYLRLLLEKKLTVPEILVVTFTNAATAELKERIRARLAEMLLLLETGEETDPVLAQLAARLAQTGAIREDIKLSLQAALASFDEAMILTIHGFCRKIAASLAFETGQPFTFEVSHEEQETLRQVVEDFWRKNIAADTLDKTLAHYLHAMRVTPETLCEFLQREISRPLAQKRWPENLSPVNRQTLEQLHESYNELADLWPSCRETLSGIIARALEEKNISAKKYPTKNLPQILDTYEQLFRHGDPAALFTLSEPGSLERLGKLTTSALEAAQNKGKTAPSHPFFACAQAWMEKRDTVLSMLERAYLHLLCQLSEETAEVRRRRQANRLLSPDDMLYRLYDALRNPALPGLPKAIRSLCPAALVDEFQDTDPIQLFIFRAIYAGSEQPLFLVGDPKQAIYRFRNADLHTYLAAKKEVDNTYALTANQRSAPEIIAACNTLFMHNPKAFMLEGISYLPALPGKRKREALQDTSIPGKAAKNGIVVWQLPHTDETRLTRAEARQASAAATAAEIVRLLAAGNNKKITIGDMPLKASDIAVLVRTHNEADIIQQALAALGLPSVSLSPNSIWASQEAGELAIILAAVAQPRSLARMKAALATELLGLNAATIEEIASHDALQLDWLEKFMACQAAWLEHGAGFAIRQIISSHDIPARLMALPEGERRLTNLLHLAELLHEAGQAYPLPESLLRWIARQRDTRPDEQTQLRLESDDRLIRIITIHAAKGLEFPFIFCPFLWDANRINRKSSLPGLLWQENGQLVMDFREHGPDQQEAIRSLMQIEEAAEHLRLIYVALTRAIYRCYLIAGCYLQPTSGKPSIKASTSGTLNWLVSSGITPQTWLKEGDEKRVNAIEAGWQSLAGNDTGITLAALPMADKANPNLPLPAAESLPPLQALPLPPWIAPGWRIGSYSALVYGAAHETQGSDRDERTAGQLPEEENPALPPDDILYFPASRYAGNCLHAVFEKADFTDETTWEQAISQALLRHPPHGTAMPQKEQSGALPGMIRSMLRQVLATPLHDGLRLETVGMDKRLTELEFFLPVKHLPAAAMNTLMDSAYRGSRLAFPVLEGYIKGMIDLVVEHNSRFYLVDWKSNFLGMAPADYTGTALEEAMAQHHYHLQHLLYTVALNRYLSQRLPGYTYNRYFGGVLYLFVRGVRPAWKTAGGSPCGVFFHRAAEETIRHLDTLLWEGTPV